MAKPEEMDKAITVTMTVREAETLIALAYQDHKRRAREGMMPIAEHRSIVEKLDAAGREAGVQVYLP